MHAPLRGYKPGIYTIDCANHCADRPIAVALLSIWLHFARCSRVSALSAGGQLQSQRLCESGPGRLRQLHTHTLQRADLTRTCLMLGRYRSPWSPLHETSILMMLGHRLLSFLTLWAFTADVCQPQNGNSCSRLPNVPDTFGNGNLAIEAYLAYPL